MPPVIEHIVSQYAEEAAFVWLLRDKAVTEPHYELHELAALDKRIEAHFAGLRLAGEEGWQICCDVLFWQDAGEIFAPAVLAFESGLKDRYDRVMEAGLQDAELARGLVSALGWLPLGTVRPYIEQLMMEEAPMPRRVGIGGAAAHRMDPGPLLLSAIQDPEPLVRSRALQAVGELGRSDLSYYLPTNFNDSDEHCRFFAARSGALLGMIEAREVLRAITEEGGTYAEEATMMASRSMEPADAEKWLQSIRSNPDLAHYAIRGMGASGNPVHIDHIIATMADDNLARVAGEAFSMITGVDLVDAQLETDWPEGYETGPTEDPEDEDVALDPDEDLPWPDQALIADWWKHNQGSYVAGRRYLLGQPITEASVQQALKTGFQRQRTAAAIEQVLLNPGHPLFETRAPGFRQQQVLGA